MAEIGRPTETYNANSSSSFSIYSNSSYGIKISYPTEWQKTEYDNRFLKNFSDIVSFKPRVIINSNNVSQKPQPTVFIRIWNLSSGPRSLEQFTKEHMGSLKNLGVLILNSSSAIIGGTSAYRVEYILKSPPTLPPLDLHGLQFWTLKNNNNKAYTITYTADPKDYSNYLAIAQTMINSFRMIK